MWSCHSIKQLKEVGDFLYRDLNCLVMCQSPPSKIFLLYIKYTKEEKKKSHLKLWKEKVLLASRITHRRGRGGLCAVTPFWLQSQQQWTPRETLTHTDVRPLMLPRCGEVISSVPARTSSWTRHFLLPRKEELHLWLKLAMSPSLVMRTTGTVQLTFVTLRNTLDLFSSQLVCSLC